MKVLVVHRPGGAFGYVTDGFINAMRAAGCLVERWDNSFLSWHAFEPDLYVGCSGHRQNIPSKATRGKTAVAIHVNPYCDTDIDGINEPKAAIEWTLVQKPDCVFGYGHETDRHYWRYWTDKHGIAWAPMPTAGDSTIYHVNHDIVLGGHERDLDVAYVGGYWPYKAKNLDQYIKPLMNDETYMCGRKLKAEMRGWGDWPALPAYKGPITDEQVVDLLNRAKVVPCVTEPHTTKWGIDLPERLFKAALCGALVVHDPVVGLHRYMPSVVMAGNPSEYEGLVRKHVAAYNTSSAIAQKQKAEVLKHHTYFDRIATLFMTLHSAGQTSRFSEWAVKLLEAK